MAQFTFKCPQCGADIEADDSFRGQVAECPSCGKGIVVPRNIANKPSPSVRLRPVARDLPSASQPTSATTTPNRMTEFERMAEKEAERRRQERRHESMMMVLKVVVALLLIGGGGIFGFMKWSESKRLEAEQLRAQREAAQEAERAEAERKERIAKEEEEKSKNAVKMFHAYLDREESRLKDTIEEAKIAIEAIDLDQKEISEELERVEKEYAKLVEQNKRKHVTEFYEKAEYVMLILKSPELNRLYEKYCGEALAAVRAKYENEVNTILKMHRERTSRLRQNKAKYYASVKGINEEVEQKNEAALRRANSAKSQTQAQLNKLKERKQQLEKRLSDEQNKRVITHNTSISGNTRETNGAKNRRKRIEDLSAEIERLNREIATAEALASGNQAQMAHLEATTAETSARRKYDTALEVRQSDDNDVHSDMQHKSDVYHVAGRYEQITLDKLRTAIRISSEFQVAKAAEARKKLDYITHSTANLELMKAEEIEDIRKKIVARLAENVVDGDAPEKKPVKQEDEQ